jgi:phosphoribosyl 1,2-cyclic phosphate phosphodiesterase
LSIFYQDEDNHMKVTFLGTGTSHGVPSIDCMLGNYGPCPKGVCGKSLTDAKHARTRSSILAEFNGKRVLLDVSSDFRQQALREKIPAIDAVLITHCHADHIGGIPDIRSYTAHRQEPLDIYGSGESMDAIRAMFPYVFDPNAFFGGGIPKITTRAATAGFDLFGAAVTPLPVEHGGLSGCQGYRIDNMAYIPDLKSLSPAARQALKGLDTLILNCLRETRQHASHLVLEQSMAVARELAPRQCYFVHMSHDIDYETDSQKLDPWMMFSYDGLKIDV